MSDISLAQVMQDPSRVPANYGENLPVPVRANFPATSTRDRKDRIENRTGLSLLQQSNRLTAAAAPAIPESLFLEPAIYDIPPPQIRPTDYKRVAQQATVSYANSTPPLPGAQFIDIYA
ncbi:MAG: hypothetical protein A2521_04720 [Deltaproteobacteria bacterium RIFOXYD12_FULL_57_12]|nr:MAG: hypothetical protein A2521_04720 [Deltaproteobacteria bacterium RIFOXYD12_FULL_57_12]